MNNIPDEVLVDIFRFLPVRDLLTMRKVSVRHGRVARDKQLWKWIRIAGTKLYRDKKYVTEGGRRCGGINIDNLEGITDEEYGWIACRVGYLCMGTTKGCEEIFHQIIREREEELETGEKIVQLKELDMNSNNLSEVDDQLLDRAVVRIQRRG